MSNNSQNCWITAVQQTKQNNPSLQPNQIVYDNYIEQGTYGLYSKTDYEVRNKIYLNYITNTCNMPTPLSSFPNNQTICNQIIANYSKTTMDNSCPYQFNSS